MDIGAARERIVREHMESENRHAFDVTLATFHHPRYEIVPTGDAYDGAEEVTRYFAVARLGIAHDPLTLRGRLTTLATHPVTVTRAALRMLVS